MTYSIAYCLETILDRSIPNLFRISFGNQCSPSKAIENWEPIVDKISPFVAHLKPAINGGLKNSGEIKSAVSSLNSLVKSTRHYNANVFNEFKSKIAPP